MPRDNNQKYQQLRQQYNVFVFERFDYVLSNDKLTIKYTFNLANTHIFTPELVIHLGRDDNFIPDTLFLENIIFQIGMIELVSYWKAACSPLILIKPFKLDMDQVKFWKKIFFHGLGEFFYVNGISAEFSSFVKIVSKSDKNARPISFQLDVRRVIVPVGGGKDSVVTLELLKDDFSLIPFIINPRKASLKTAMVAGFGEKDVFRITRVIHPKLIELNELGFLNGHTPFSALIGFTSLLAASLTNAKYIALSNESSANEPTVINGPNHQYSKSYSFEKDFREYVREYVSPDLEYFSFLRPLSEFSIARIFTKFLEYLPYFRSCNAGSKTDIWCGSCPKCLFTAIILSPFIDHSTLVEIFGSDLLDQPDLISDFNALTGLTDIKPFECVGTVDEVNKALNLTINNYGDELPYLLDYYKSTPLFLQQESIDVEEQIDIESGNFLPRDFLEILKMNIDGC